MKLRSAPWHVVLAIPLLLAACSEQAFVGASDEGVQLESAATPPAFRNGQLLGRALQAPTETDASERLGLIVGLHAAPAKFFNRYRLSRGAALTDRRLFDEAFQGFSATIEAEAWPNVRAALEKDPDVAWFEPDVRLLSDDPVRAALGLAAGPATASDAIAALERRLKSGTPVALPASAAAPALEQALRHAAARGPALGS